MTHPRHSRRPKRLLATVENQKGGSTKTSTTVNLGAAFVELGFSVRMIDSDPQEGSLTHWIPPQDDVGHGLLEVYQERRTLDEVTSRTTVSGLYVVPSWRTLREVEHKREPGAELIMRAAIHDSEAPIDVDLIDSPHTLDVLAIGATAAVDILVVPVQASELDVVGMAELLEMTERVRRRINPELRIGAVVVGRVKGRSGFDARLIQQFTEGYPQAVVAPIADSVKMREATAAHLPINLYERGGRCAQDFAELAKRLAAAEGISPAERRT